MVHGLQRLRFPRALASGVAVIGLIAVVAALLTLAGRSIAQGIGDLWGQAAEGIDQVTAWLSTGPFDISQTDIEGWLESARDSLSGATSGIVSGALSVTTTLGHVFAGTLIALFCTFFFLLDGRRIWTWVVGLAPRATRQQIHQAGRRGVVTLGAYTRTQILVAAVDAVGIGVPLALPLGILVFVGSFVPIVGAIITGSVAILVALVSLGPFQALIMLAIVLGVQQLEGHVLQPFLMGHAVSLHPVAVLLAVTAGSFLAGIVGALFAVPIAAVVNTVVLYLHGHDTFPQLGEDDPVPIRPIRPHPHPRAGQARLGAGDEARGAGGASQDRRTGSDR